MFRSFNSVELCEGIRGRESEGIGLERRAEQASACVKQRGEEEMLSSGMISSMNTRCLEAFLFTGLERG